MTVGLLRLRQLQETHRRLYGALHLHRLSDSRSDREFTKVTGYAAKHEARFMNLLMAQDEDGGKRKNAAVIKEGNLCLRGNYHRRTWRGYQNS